MNEHQDEAVYLDMYDSENSDVFNDGEHQTIWCWKKGLFSSQEFESEDAALQAFENKLLVFSSLDNEDLLGALYATAEINENLNPPFNYWLVDGSSVWEPRANGQLLGELPEYRIVDGMKVLKISRQDFEWLQDASDDT